MKKIQTKTVFRSVNQNTLFSALKNLIGWLMHFCKNLICNYIFKRLKYNNWASLSLSEIPPSLPPCSTPGSEICLVVKCEAPGVNTGRYPLSSLNSPNIPNPKSKYTRESELRDKVINKFNRWLLLPNTTIATRVGVINMSGDHRNVTLSVVNFYRKWARPNRFGIFVISSLDVRSSLTSHYLLGFSEITTIFLASFRLHHQTQRPKVGRKIYL